MEFIQQLEKDIYQKGKDDNKFEILILNQNINKMLKNIIKKYPLAFCWPVDSVTN